MKRINRKAIILVLIIALFPVISIFSQEEKVKEVYKVTVFHQKKSGNLTEQFEIEHLEFEEGDIYRPELKAEGYDRLRIRANYSSSSSEVEDIVITGDTRVVIDYVYYPIDGPYTVSITHSAMMFDLTDQMKADTYFLEGIHEEPLLNPLDYDPSYHYDLLRVRVYDEGDKLIARYYDTIKPFDIQENQRIMIDYIELAKLDINVYINGVFERTVREKAFLDTEYTVDPENYNTDSNLVYESASGPLDVTFSRDIQSLNLYYSKEDVPVTTLLKERYIVKNNYGSESIIKEGESEVLVGSIVTTIPESMESYVYVESINRESGVRVTFPFTVSDDIMEIDHIFKRVRDKESILEPKEPTDSKEIEILPKTGVSSLNWSTVTLIVVAAGGIITYLSRRKK